MSTAISKAKTRFILNLNNRKRMAKAEQIPAIIKKAVSYTHLTLPTICSV